MALRIPSPVALTKPEAYLAYKAGILSRGELKDKLLNPINNYEGWLAKWCELLETYPTNEDGTPQCLTDEEGLLAYLCGVTNRYPASNSNPDDARVSAYIRYLISARYARPDHPLNREEFYLSLIKTQFIPSGDPSSDIVIDGTTKAPFLDVKMYGDTLQNSYSGKNLLDESTIYHGYYDPGVPSTLVADERYMVATINNLPAGTYTFSCSLANCYLLRWAINDTNTSINEATSSYTFTTSSTGTFRICFRTEPTAVITASFNTMIESGSSATSYEPYVGGTPAPNPDYPQPISVVTGENVVKVVGKNLLEVHSGTTATFGGVTATRQEDGSILLDGTATANAWLEFGVDFKNGTTAQTTPYALLDPTKTYTLSSSIRSGTYTSGGGTTNVTIQGSTAQPQNWTCNIDGSATVTGANGIYRAYIRISTGDVFNNAVIQPQLELGSTATPYQAYTEQDYAISLTGKNLFNKATSTAGYRLDSNGDPYANAAYFISDYIVVQPSTTYAYSRGAAGSGLSTIAYYKSDKTFISRTMPTIGSSDTSGTVTTPNNAYYARFCDVNEVLDSAQLELGSTATEYTPYSPIELAKIGTYQDRIYKEGEKWYVEKQLGKTVFDGAQSFTSFRDVTTFITANYTSSAILRLPSNIVTTMSDKLTGATLGQTYSGSVIYGVSQASNGQYLQVSLKPEDASDANGVKTFFATHPTTVYYVLATPTTTEITNQSLIDQLNALKQGGAEEGTTYIKVSATDPNLPAKLYVEAPKYD